MSPRIEYSPTERFWLWVLAAFGFVAVNGAFLYGAFVRPEILAAVKAIRSRSPSLSKHSC